MCLKSNNYFTGRISKSRQLKDLKPAVSFESFESQSFITVNDSVPTFQKTLFICITKNNPLMLSRDLHIKAAYSEIT
jgi:hypothetical protein